MRFSAANIIIIKEGAMILGLLQKKKKSRLDMMMHYT